MASYNSFERLAARFLSSSPFIKKIIKRAYQIVNYYINKPNSLFESKYKCSEVNPDKKESFFGYYDKSPKNGSLILYQTSKHKTKELPINVARSGGTIEVNVFDERSGEIIFSRPTSAFNWQQGSKLQWIDSQRFIYNDLNLDGKAHLVLFDLTTGKESHLTNPVYDSYKDQYYLSLDYLPLTELRPDYAYFSTKAIDVDYDNQYIRICDFDCKSHDILSIKEINEKFPLSFLCDFSKQKFNHIMISPHGDKFIFLHRAYTNNGQRIDRLFVANFDQSRRHVEVSLISDSGVISHYCWKDNDSLISYMKHNGVMSYYTIELESLIEIKKIDIEKLDYLGDGHPTWIGGGKFITDTYPDKSRIKKLLLVDVDSSSFEVIGEFFEPLAYDGQTRCDLHPKWDSVSKSIFVESVHDGYRQLYELGPINV